MTSSGHSTPFNISSSETMRRDGNNQSQHELFDNLPVAVYTCDRHGYISSFNKAAEKLWGRTPEIGKDLWCGSWKIYQPNGEPLALNDCPMAVTLRKGIPIEGEEIMVERPDGTRIDIMPYPVPLFDENGVITGAVNTLIDITEQKSNRNKERMLAAIIESSEDAIISKTLEGIVTSWNQSAEQMFGYTEKDIVGKSITLLIPVDRLDEETVILAKIRNGEKVGHYETIRLAKNGSEIPVSLTISPIKDIKGIVIGASKIARDISKQKIAEERLHRYAEHLTLLNSVDKLVSESLDMRDILQSVTDATTRLTGADCGAFFYKGDESDNSDMQYTLSGDPKEAFGKFGMLSNTDTFNSIFNGERVIRCDDLSQDARYGKKAFHTIGIETGLPIASYLAVPVISKSNEVIGGLFYAHPDKAKFTAEHENLVMGVAIQAAIALENARLYSEIQKLNSKKDEFIGLASHELKTPLASLNGYLQIIDRELKDADPNKIFIQKALQQINKLSRLIADLLDVSKIETGKLPFSFSSFDICELMEEVIDLMKYTSRSHRIELNCDLKQLMVLADRQRIEQVVINLISNAIKYSSNANLVKVMVYEKEESAIVAVQDFGIGINKKQQGHIFSRFYRVDDLDTHISGLGIGLYISKEIIMRHHGKITVSSEPGAGSTFVFEIPRKQFDNLAI